MAQVLSVKDFASTIQQAQHPVLIDFYADWCGPCKMVSPIVEELAGQYEGQLDVYKVNVDDSPEIAGQYQIMSIPTLMFFKNGVSVRTQIGFVPKPVLENMIKEVL